MEGTGGGGGGKVVVSDSGDTHRGGDEPCPEFLDDDLSRSGLCSCVSLISSYTVLSC